MKFSFIFSGVLVFSLMACGGGKSESGAETSGESTSQEESASVQEPSVETIAGTWELVNYSSEKKPEAGLTECDKATPWNFTTEAAEPLSDGTEVNKLVAVAPDSCEWYGFETKWTIANGKLFMASTKIGGMGGLSLAGSITIDSFDGKTMVLTSFGNKLEFSRR